MVYACYFQFLLKFEGNILKVLCFSVEYTMSRRGRRMVKWNNYTYCVSRVTGPKTRWRCSTHFNKRCVASLLTFHDELVSAKHQHNHDPANIDMYGARLGDHS